MIELTSGYKSSTYPKFLLNPLHIIYISPCDVSRIDNYAGVNSFIEYIGAGETQTAYVVETYEQIKEMLK